MKVSSAEQLGPDRRPGWGLKRYSRLIVDYHHKHRGDKITVAIGYSRYCIVSLWRRQHGEIIEFTVACMSWRAARQILSRWAARGE